MANILHLEGKLERFNASVQWGFRLQGGKDFGSPLIISKVTDGSLADKCGLHVGDMLIKIGNFSTEILKHQEAQDKIKACGNKLDLLLQRNKGNFKYQNGGGGFPKYNTADVPRESVPPPAPIQQKYETPSFNAPSTNYNAAPKPFASGPGANNAAPKPFASGPGVNKPYGSVSPKSPGASGDHIDNTHAMKNLDISQPSNDQSLDKFAALDDRTARAAGDMKPNQPVRQYNNPSGLYSSNTKSSPASPNQIASGDTKAYIHSETYKMVHEQDAFGDSPPEKSERKYSTTLTKIQQQLDIDNSDSTPTYHPMPSQPPPKKWEPPKSSPPAPAPAPVAPPPVAQGAKPWQQQQHQPPLSSGRPAWAPSKPSGAGTHHGKQGDALMKDAVATDGRIPVCASCQIAIRGPFVVAMGKTWCPDHFVCANPNCNTKLVDIGFVEEGGALYCERDYERYFAPHCTKCQAAIIGTCVNALQKTWHPHCFTCNKCHQPISGGSFHVEEGLPYCDADWTAMFQTMCCQCAFPIEPGDRWVEAMNKNWHANCFNCSMCQVNLEGQPFFPKGGKPYCKKHNR